MFTVIGRTYERLGIYDKALPALEQALAIGRRAFGNEHVRVAQSLNDLGVLHRASRQPAAAEPLLAESLAMRRRLLGSQHPDLAITLVEWARLLRDPGQHRPKPKRRRVRRWPFARRCYGDEHRQTATSKSELGLLAVGQERSRRAPSRCCARTWRRASACSAPDHPNVAVRRKASLGALLTAKGDSLR